MILFKAIYPVSKLIFWQALLLSISITAQAEIILVTTTTVENSGLLHQLLQGYKKEGDSVRAIVASTGRALAIGRSGDADILLTHDSIAEKDFVNNGYGYHRREYMYNYFIIVGPQGGKTLLSNLQTPQQALAVIAQEKKLFISRGDDSGTYRKELTLWQHNSQHSWYIESGQGMAATLRIASELGGYTITDTGTWHYLADALQLAVVYNHTIEAMKNYYSITLINPELFPHINYDGAQHFLDWLISDPALEIITNWKKNGQPLFIPIVD